MKDRAHLVVAVIATIALVPMQVRSQAPGSGQPAASPLAPFGRLIGGQWHLEGSYQEFEWGVGRRSVRARSYFILERGPKLVSEGIWYWHPGEKQIRGVFTAIDMPVVFFDYRTRFEGAKMINELSSYDLTGGETAYVETWDFTDETHFEWKLFRKTPDGLQEEMGGTYARKTTGNSIATQGLLQD
jgi:hypothetical protein